MTTPFLLAAILILAIAQEATAGTVVPLRAIRAQTKLALADLQIVEGFAPGSFETLEALVGLEAKVTLYPGHPILAENVGPGAKVERNQIILITFATGSLQITTEGRALDRGGAGELIRVMNLTSKTTIMGRVQEDGSVAVGQ